MKKSAFSQVQLNIMSFICCVILFASCLSDPEPNPVKMVAKEKSVISSVENLSEDEISSLLFMVEEEKLAKDVYDKMFQLYGLTIFQNIYQSETRHVEAVSKLIEKYGLTNPINDKLPGEFDNEELQQLYTDLIDLGTVSKLQAINVGVIIENKDIIDIQGYLDLVVVSKDIEMVYNHLLDGSVNHLAAFELEL